MRLHRIGRHASLKPMSTTAIPLKEFDEEMKTTRRLLERVPSDKATWKPHEKSFSLGHLAQLVSWMPGWIANTLTSDELDLSRADRYSQETTQALLDGFDRNVAKAREAISTAKDSDLQKPWSLKMG